MKKWMTLLLALTIAGCGLTYHLLTPTELTERGTRHFSGASLAQATEACATALETLGYKVTLKEASTGVVKTAPKVVSVSATGGAGYANAREDALAWAIRIDAESGSGVRIQAAPRGFSNGNDISARGFPDTVIDPKFQALWSEVGSMLKPN